MLFICLDAGLRRYAREDTHYLLYMYDVMKRRLLSESSTPDLNDSLLAEVRSFPFRNFFFSFRKMMEYKQIAWRNSIGRNKKKRKKISAPIFYFIFIIIIFLILAMISTICSCVHLHQSVSQSINHSISVGVSISVAGVPAQL